MSLLQGKALRGKRRAKPS